MVMSQQLTPRITLGGALIVGVLALGSWLATPTLADPSPDGGCEKTEKQAEKAAGAKAAGKAEQAVKAYEHALQHRLAGTTETAAAELARALQALAGDCDDTREGLSLEARIKLLEEHLQKLAALLESRLQGLDKKMPKLIKELDLSQLKELDLSQLKELDLSKVKQLEHFSQLQELSELPDMPDMPDLEKIIGRAMASGQGHALPQLMVGGTVAQPGKSVYEETYELPEGRLDALTKLMVRQDVPVLVSPGEGKITVHGTLQQQMIFRAFCDMIKGGEHQVEYELPEGKLDALVELMILDDVPIRVRPGEGCIEVHGNTLEQTIFEAFVDMINAEGAAPGIEVQIRGGTLQPPAAPKPPKPGKPGAAAYKAKTHAFKQQLEVLHQQMRAHAAEYEKYMHQAEKLEAKAEQVENEADELEDQADELEGEARIAKIAEANHLMLKAQQLFNEARILEARADVIEAMAEQLEDQAEALEDRLEDLYEQMEEEDDD